jgi:hypothetical protein
VKHHYVPQFLLKRWTNPDGKVQVIAVRNGRVISKARAPEYTGYENQLYAVVANAMGLAEDVLERQVFAPIDSDAARVLEKLEAHDPITQDDHIAWTFFLSSLRIRQPDVLEFLRTKGIERLRADLADRDKATLPLGAPTTEEWFERHFPGHMRAASLASWLPQMVTHDGVLDRFGSLNWWIQDFEADLPELLLSDLPIHWEGGFNQPGFLIQLPVGPHRVFFGAASEQTEQYLGGLSHADLIHRINLTSLAASSDRVWARGADTRTFVEANIDKMGKNAFPFSSLLPRLELTAAEGDEVTDATTQES